MVKGQEGRSWWLKWEEEESMVQAEGLIPGKMGEEKKIKVCGTSSLVLLGIMCENLCS